MLKNESNSKNHRPLFINAKQRDKLYVHRDFVILYDWPLYLYSCHHESIEIVLTERPKYELLFNGKKMLIFGRSIFELRTCFDEMYNGSGYTIHVVISGYGGVVNDPLNS